MAMFSEGGLTSPDIWIVITIILTASISILLNPLVFRHNTRKKRSIARDLYMALSTTDFISSIVLPAVLCQRILQPKEEQCIKDYDATFCKTEYYNYNRTATTAEEVVDGVKWGLMYAPISITSVLAASRWYQISYPFRVLNRTAVEMFLAAMCSFQMIYIPLMFLADSAQNPTLMMMNILTVWNPAPFGFDRYFVLLEHIVGILQSSLSIIASLLTIWNLIQSPTVPGNSEIRARRMRSTLKIALLNAGNLAYLGSALILTARTGLEKDIFIATRVTFCFVPVLLSTYNPVLYTVLTNDILNNNPRD